MEKFLIYIRSLIDELGLKDLVKIKVNLLAALKLVENHGKGKHIDLVIIINI